MKSNFNTQLEGYTHEITVLLPGETFDQWQKRMQAEKNPLGWNVCGSIFTRPKAVLKKWGTYSQMMDEALSRIEKGCAPLQLNRSIMNGEDYGCETLWWRRVRQFPEAIDFFGKVVRSRGRKTKINIPESVKMLHVDTLASDRFFKPDLPFALMETISDQISEMLDPSKNLKIKARLKSFSNS